MAAKDGRAAQLDRVLEGLYFPRTGVGWDLAYLEIPALAGLACCGEVSANDTASEGKLQVIPVGFAIDPNQPFNGYLQTGFFPHFADHGFCWQLTALDAAARQAPRIQVAAVAQESAALFIEDDCKCTDCEQIDLLVYGFLYPLEQLGQDKDSGALVERLVVIPTFWRL